MTLRAAIASSVLLILVGAQAHGRVQVHVGYLDKEVDGILRTLVRDNPGKTVLAVSTSLSDGEIFGHTAASYAAVGSTPTFATTGADGATGPEAQVASALDASAKKFTAARDLPSLMLDGANSASYGATSFTVANLNPQASAGGKSPDDVIIVLKSPELGRQPGMLQGYLDMLLPALDSLPQAAAAKGGLHVSSFGTAGGIAPQNGPDHVDRIKSSLFVGVERVPGSTPGQYVGKISYASTEQHPGDPKQPVDFYVSAPFSDYHQAEDEAKRAFIDLAGRAQGKAPVACPPDAAPAATPLTPIKGAMVGIFKSLLSDSSMSLSTSFFGGPDIKKAAADLGILDVNMEDYHVILAAQRMKDAGHPLSSLALNRVIADPPHIPTAALKSLNEWLDHGAYSHDEYADAIVWGLKGAHLEDAPASADWDAFAGIDPKETALLTTHIPMQGKRLPYDPFIHSIARDFLDSDFSAGTLRSWIVRNTAAGETAPSGPALDAALDAKATVVAGLIAQLRAKAAAGSSSNQLKVTSNKLVAELASLTVGSGAAAKKFPLLEDPRWPGRLRNTGSAEELESTPPLSEQDAERFLYKISLSALTASTARDFVRAENLRIETAAKTQPKQ